jgi:hypothetical protein
MIRTLAEVRADNVTITVSVDDALSTVRKICNWCPEGTWDNRFHPDGASHVQLYTAAEVGDAQASEAELVAAPLRRRIGELEAGLTEIDKEADRLRGVVIGYDLDRHTERERADKAQARVRELGQSLAARDRLLETATRKASAARDFLTASTVAEARENIVTSRGAVLADAIGNALRVLDQA